MAVDTNGVFCVTIKTLKEHHTNIEDSRLWNVYAKRLLHGKQMP